MKKEIPLLQAHRLLSPRPVVLLSAHYRGQDNVMAVAWVCPVSLQPPLVAVAVHPSRYSHDMIGQSEEFVLNVPGRRLMEQVWTCGTLSGGEVDKITACGLEIEAGRHVQAPWIADCLAHLECAVVTRVQPGDHTVFVAQVVGAWAEEEAFDEVWRVNGVEEELLPLHHLGGTAFALMGQSLEQDVPPPS